LSDWLGKSEDASVYLAFILFLCRRRCRVFCSGSNWQFISIWGATLPLKKENKEMHINTYSTRGQVHQAVSSWSHLWSIRDESK